MLWYVQHSLSACLMLFVFLALFRATSSSFQARHMATVVPIAYFFGREMRDWEKEGFLDWPGLLAPVLSSLFTMTYL